MPSTKTLQELIIAVHFEAPLTLTVVDLADWVAQFSKGFPIIQQLPSLPTANLTSPLAGQMQLQMLATSPLPRMLVRSAEGKHSVQLQDDRFGFGCPRTEPPGGPSQYARSE